MLRQRADPPDGARHRRCPDRPPTPFHLIVGTIAGSALGAVLGVAIGTLVRNQLGAIVAVAAYANAMNAGVFAAGVFVACTLAFIATETVRNNRSGV